MSSMNESTTGWTVRLSVRGEVPTDEQWDTVMAELGSNAVGSANSTKRSWSVTQIVDNRATAEAADTSARNRLRLAIYRAGLDSHPFITTDEVTEDPPVPAPA